MKLKKLIKKLERLRYKLTIERQQTFNKYKFELSLDIDRIDGALAFLRAAKEHSPKKASSATSVMFPTEGPDGYIAQLEILFEDRELLVKEYLRRDMSLTELNDMLVSNNWPDLVSVDYWNEQVYAVFPTGSEQDFRGREKAYVTPTC